MCRTPPSGPPISTTSCAALFFPSSAAACGLRCAALPAGLPAWPPAAPRAQPVPPHSQAPMALSFPPPPHHPSAPAHLPPPARSSLTLPAWWPATTLSFSTSGPTLAPPPATLPSTTPTSTPARWSATGAGTTWRSPGPPPATATRRRAALLLLLPCCRRAKAGCCSLAGPTACPLWGHGRQTAICWLVQHPGPPDIAVHLPIPKRSEWPNSGGGPGPRAAHLAWPPRTSHGLARLRASLLAAAHLVPVAWPAPPPGWPGTGARPRCYKRAAATALHRDLPLLRCACCAGMLRGPGCKLPACRTVRN